MKRLLASGGRFLVPTELVVSGADVVPCFGIVWPQCDRCSTRGDRFDITLLAIMLKTDIEIILRSLRRRLIDWLTIRLREKIPRGQIGRAQLQCAVQERACLIGARVREQVTRIIGVAVRARRSESQRVLEMLLRRRALLRRIF